MSDVPVRRLLVVGIGVGGLDQVTVEAAAALGRADVVFVLDKGEETADLAALRRAVLARHAPGRAHRVVEVPDPPRDRADPAYAAAVGDWHEARAALLEGLIADALDEAAHGAFLVWGDPSLYDSTLRILDRIAARGRLALDVTVFPGLSSPQLLAARHRIVLNRVGGALHVTTGRRLAEGWPPGADDVVVMLDGAQAFRRHLGQGLAIWWGAYLGSPEELLIAGPLDAVADEIARARDAARARRGWIMDTYLLRRP